MPKSRHALARISALTGLAIFLIYFIDEIMKEGGSLGGFLPIANPMARGLVFQLIPLALSGAAFALSKGKPSVLVSASLVTTGSLMVIDGITTGTRFFTILTVPGPIIGFTYGIAILALGIVKGLTTRRVLRFDGRKHLSGN
jgi:hypothetical protein